MVFVRDIAMGRVIDGLMSMLAGVMPAETVVQEGPPVGSQTIGASGLVLIGHNGDPDSDARPSYAQQPSSLLGESRYETGEIPCAVLSQSGDTDASTVRDQAVLLLGTLTAAFYADRTLGGAAMTCQLTSGTESVYQNQAGAVVVLAFTITYMAQV